VKGTVGEYGRPPKYAKVKKLLSSGTVVLVAGTVTVSDIHVTVDSIIRLTVLTPGGTQGKLSTSSLTAAQGFTIKSTSATDTSTIFYEVEAY